VIDIKMIREAVMDHCIALHCIALHCIALHCIALHCIALHCIALHCIALHCSIEMDMCPSKSNSLPTENDNLELN
jgi:hypothetical protein